MVCQDVANNLWDVIQHKGGMKITDQLINNAYMKGNLTKLIIRSDEDNYFYNAYCTHQNECTVRTNNSTVHTFSECSYSNLSFRIKLRDICTHMNMIIYSAMEIQVNWLIIL